MAARFPVRVAHWGGAGFQPPSSSSAQRHSDDPGVRCAGQAARLMEDVPLKGIGFNGGWKHATPSDDPDAGAGGRVSLEGFPGAWFYSPGCLFQIQGGREHGSNTVSITRPV